MGNFIGDILSKILEFIFVAFFWLFDKLAAFLVKSGIVESETTAQVISISIVCFIYLVLNGIFISPKRIVGGSMYESEG
ncbi:hypothetical protein [Gracilibacillus xinjiangensis]|uniref:Uncharacterized protein n=1 Tax=Gracilibacillus xinjiangensis TaxID=1193282 RepID=A0ABV8WVS1_9BACI